MALKRGKDRRAVEQRLEALAEQRESLDIHDLPSEEHQRLRQEWDDAQLRFVHDPGQSVADADRLVNGAMKGRGYPVESFDDRVALLATDHQDLVEGYRGAHDTFVAHLQSGTGGTEELRTAFLSYLNIFERLNVPSDRKAVEGTTSRAPATGANTAPALGSRESAGDTTGDTSVDTSPAEGSRPAAVRSDVAESAGTGPGDVTRLVEETSVDPTRPDEAPPLPSETRPGTDTGGRHAAPRGVDRQ
jgi:hypothetical protein